jgi:hypothetical protein
MHSRCEQQICPVYNNAEMHREKMKDRSGRVIKDDTEVFLSDKRTTEPSLMEMENHVHLVSNCVTSSIFLMTFVP